MITKESVTVTFNNTNNHNNPIYVAAYVGELGLEFNRGQLLPLPIVHIKHTSLFHRIVI